MKFLRKIITSKWHVIGTKSVVGNSFQNNEADIYFKFNDYINSYREKALPFFLKVICLDNRYSLYTNDSSINQIELIIKTFLSDYFKEIVSFIIVFISVIIVKKRTSNCYMRQRIGLGMYLPNSTRVKSLPTW